MAQGTKRRTGVSGPFPSRCSRSTSAACRARSLTCRTNDCPSSSSFRAWEGSTFVGILGSMALSFRDCNRNSSWSIGNAPRSWAGMTLGPRKKKRTRSTHKGTNALVRGATQIRPVSPGKKNLPDEAPGRTASLTLQVRAGPAGRYLSSVTGAPVLVTRICVLSPRSSEVHSACLRGQDSHLLPAL